MTSSPTALPLPRDAEAGISRQGVGRHRPGGSDAGSRIRPYLIAASSRCASGGIAAPRPRSAHQPSNGKDLPLLAGGRHRRRTAALLKSENVAVPRLKRKLNETLKRLRGKRPSHRGGRRGGHHGVNTALPGSRHQRVVCPDFVAKVTRAGRQQRRAGLLFIAIHSDRRRDRVSVSSRPSKLASAPPSPTVVMMVGLNGASRPHHHGQAQPHRRQYGISAPCLSAATSAAPPPSGSWKVVGGQLDLPVFAGRARSGPIEIAPARHPPPGTAATTSSSWIPPAPPVDESTPSDETRRMEREAVSLVSWWWTP